MNKTDELRSQINDRGAVPVLALAAHNHGDFAVVDGELYSVARARCGIGVDAKGKPIYKQSETLVRLIPPDAASLD